MFVSRKEFKKQLQEFSKQNQECQELIQTLQQQLLELAYEVDVVNREDDLDEVLMGYNNKTDQYYVTHGADSIYNFDTVEEALELFDELCVKQERII